ncbi:S8 family serine peptidase [Luteimonas sp. SJ-92]|uniref:S8 family serine peptidase n=1 Tax=Luteimonas salinisoli TaxID=2752307 RepID=A0A853J9R5_9GAMM|nr:S8 family serine peptidase [Luteimonas salinisoli]NZA25419.1 S8 family serine peptidase [Luteimonas salinisoli]
MSRKKHWVAVATLIALAAVAGASTLQFRSGPDASGNRATAAGQATGAVAAAAVGQGGAVAARPAVRPDAGRDDGGTYVVVLREPALGAYRGEVAGLPAPPRRADARGKLRLDSRGAAARNYVGYLRTRQQQLEGEIAVRIGRPLAVRERMQHAVNAIVTDLGGGEADRIRALPEVLLVEEYREYVLDTDTGPGLIGADALWDGSAPGADAAWQGEGVVFGILDSGINFGSPSFAAEDPVDGYVHVNPLGAGNHLGSCAAGDVDEGRCNDKLVAGYDFVCGPPANLCGQPNIREEPGFGDSNGHGTHVASTAAGNRRDDVFRGNPVSISGVAPRANIVAFDICYTNTATGQGLCPNVSAVAAVDQAIADGIVDVINYSIGGGSQPWSEVVSLAFLGAVDAGIYVATSAGNSGPGPNTMGHLEPWVSSTAASQHGRGAFSVLLQVTGPEPVPEPLSPVLLNEGSNGVAHDATIPGTTPLRVSDGYDGDTDACAALPAGSFDGAIAVVRRGGCAFSIKVNNADAAGAVAVVIANNADGGLIPSVPGTAIPAFGVTQADGDALRDFARAHADATAMIGFPAVPLPNTVDALGAFSSRGPAGNFDLLKPDVTAPGVSILAADAGTTITGFEQLLGLKNGTSMASPHQAGAAGLLRQARPGWTMPEIKSALAMTADQTVLLEDEVTPADPFARGAGRIRVDLAINAGLVMDENAGNYLAANPAEGGDPSALNQPSLASGRCFEGCEFIRTFRNPTSRAQVWRPRLEGLQGRVTPASLKVPAGGSRSVRVTIDSRALPADGSWHFGTVVLEPAGGLLRDPLPVLRLPVAVSVPPPAIALPDLVTASIAQGQNGSVDVTVGNAGGSTLEFSVDNTGSATLQVADVKRGAVTSGYRSTLYTDPGADPPGAFASDDFVLASQTRIGSLFTEGFVSSGGALATVAQAITWSIYPDAAGMPAGDPQTSPGAAVWSHTATPGAPGVDTTGNHIGLELEAAGQDVVLPAGRYWLVVHTHATLANRWVWFAAPSGSGSFMVITPGADGTGTWSPVSSFAGLSMTVSGTVECGASWLGPVTPPMGRLAPGASRPLRMALGGAGLTPGTYGGNLCVASNDPVTPKAAAPVRLTVTP